MITKSCPFCDSIRIDLETLRSVARFVCSSCGACGPKVKIVDYVGCEDMWSYVSEAAAKWDERAIKCTS